MKRLSESHGESIISPMPHLAIENVEARGAPRCSAPVMAQVRAPMRCPVDIAAIVDGAMRQDATIGGLHYMAFDHLPGVRESASFRFCARQIVGSYVELLVLQDELRRDRGHRRLDDFGIKNNKSSSSSLDALNIVNQTALWREFSALNAVAAKIVEHFSSVREAYGRTPKPQGCWRESLEGGFVALALRLKSQITGVTKISKESAIFLGNDVPLNRSCEDVARFIVRCVNRPQPDGTPEGQEASSQMEAARALALETIDAFVAVLLRKSSHFEELSPRS